MLKLSTITATLMLTISAAHANSWCHYSGCSGMTQEQYWDQQRQQGQFQNETITDRYGNTTTCTSTRMGSFTTTNCD